MRRLNRPFLALALVATVVAGCGASGDETDDAAPTSDTTSASSSVADDAGTTTDGGDAAEDGGDTTEVLAHRVTGPVGSVVEVDSTLTLDAGEQPQSMTYTIDEQDGVEGLAYTP